MSLKTVAAEQVVVGLVLLFPTIVFAACEYIESSTNLIRINMPEHITLPRDLALGTTLFESSALTQSNSARFVCTTSVAFGVQNNLGSSVVGATQFPIGNTGLSWVVTHNGNLLKAYGTMTIPGRGYNNIGSVTQLRII